MADRAKLTVGICAMLAALFGFAFVAGPRSCEWGSEGYFWAGVVTLPALFAWPFVVRAGRRLLIQVGLGLAFAGLGVVVWFGGLFAANFRIVCRLF
jgi:hypothetical protein